MKNKIIGLLLFLSIFVITGCENRVQEEPKANEQKVEEQKTVIVVAGTYEGQYTKLVGASESEKDTSDNFYLVLDPDGTGIHHRNDSEYKLTWTNDGENISIKETFVGISIDYNGTLKDNDLVLYNGDKTNDFTMQYVYKKK